MVRLFAVVAAGHDGKSRQQDSGDEGMLLFHVSIFWFLGQMSVLLLPSLPPGGRVRRKSGGGCA